MTGTNQETWVFVGRAQGASTRLCYGNAARRRTVRGGALHLFAAGQVVGYLIASEREQRCYVFRTGVQDAATLVRVVGVTPKVCVLMAATGGQRCSQVQRLFKLVERAGVPADCLSDMFFVRAGMARERYVPIERTVAALLHEDKTLMAARGGRILRTEDGRKK